jgi:integrase
MAVRRRGKRWVADYYDSVRARRWKTFDTREAAKDFEAVQRTQRNQAQRPEVDPAINLKDYADRWLGQLAATAKPSTFALYRQRLDLHILPALGKVPLRDLGRKQIRDFLFEKLKEKKKRRRAASLDEEPASAQRLSAESVRILYSVLRALLFAAVDEEVLNANPAAKLGKALRLTASKATRQEKVKAFDRAQLGRFLDAASAKQPRLWPLFFVMSRTGLRLGEALALQWGDLDLVARTVRIERARSAGGEVSTPKSGHGRTVDMATSVHDLLKRHRARLSEAWLKRKPGRDAEGNELPEGSMPPWAFPSEHWTLLDHSNVRKGFDAALKHAGPPSHFSPHSLRHTFASLLLADGVSPAYVQEQLGHASIGLTVDTYGRWLKKAGSRGPRPARFPGSW